ncbi:MAG: alpha/beta hydrolase [Bacteroidetes bacterium]|nr:MAG: alpha/beta hydrolase [Bacteroidota bacterium]
MLTQREYNGWLLVENKPNQPNYKILLLPGLQGSDLVFQKLLESDILASNGIHVIAGNPPGFKGLPVPADFNFSIESFAAQFEKIAAEEKVDLILGHSFAANVLIEVAARKTYKGMLFLISPSLTRDSETKELLMLDSFSRKPLLSGIMWWVTYMMMDSIFKPYFDDTTSLASVVRDGKKIPRDVGRKTLLGYFDNIDMHKNLAKRLVETETQVHYVRGSKDDIKFSVENKNFLQSSPKIRVHEIEGARHFAMLDKPDEVATLIVNALGVGS